jgi:hypothetical protein
VDLMVSHMRTGPFRLHVRMRYRHMGGVQLTNPCYINTVSTQLTSALDQRSQVRRGSTTDEGFNGESDWRQGVIDVARGRRSTRILGSDSGT